MRFRVLASLLVLALFGCKKDEVKKPEPTGATTWPEASLLAMGTDHACGVASNGEVRCFGGPNTFGQAGKGVKLAVSGATAATGLDDHPVRLIGAPYDTCALYKDGKLECVGNKARMSQKPGLVDPADPLVDLGISGDSACLLQKSGKLSCWHPAFDLAPVADLPPAASVSVANNLVCAVTRDHDAYCWHFPRGGNQPLEKVASNVSEIATTGAVTCIISTDHKLSCRGSSNRGLLGTTSESKDFVPLADNAEQVSLADHACFLRAGVPYCWGYNAYGEVGNGTLDNQTAPVKVQTDDTFVRVMAYHLKTCGRTTKGQLVCWGLRTKDDMTGEKKIERFAPLTIAGL